MCVYLFHTVYIYIHRYMMEFARSFTVRCPHTDARASSIGVILSPSDSYYVNRTKTEDVAVQLFLQKHGISVRPCVFVDCHSRVDVCKLHHDPRGECKARILGACANPVAY